MNKIVLSSVILAAFLACTPFEQPPHPPEPMPTPVVVDTEYCDAAEANLIKLNCPEGQPTKRGERFGDVCRELHSEGIFVNPRCLSTITSCTSVDVCTRTIAPN